MLNLNHDWRERLQAMEAHLDIRKRLVLERTSAQRGLNLPTGLNGLLRGRDR